MGEVVCADDVCAFAVRGRIGLLLDIMLRSFGRFWRPQDDRCGWAGGWVPRRGGKTPAGCRRYRSRRGDCADKGRSGLRPYMAWAM